MATRGRTAASPKPRGASKPPAAPRRKVVPVADAALELEQWEADHEPLPAEPEPEPARFPFEQRRGHDPVAVFNTYGGDTSENERLAFPSSTSRVPLQFYRGLLAVFSEGDAAYVRKASMGGRLYREATDDRLFARPFVCDACKPPTRWYSQETYQAHNRRKHQG